MLHNPTVLRDDVIVGLWLKPFAPEIMPVIAAQLLAAGYHSPAQRAAAGLAAHGEPRGIGGASGGAWWMLAAGSPAARLPVRGAAVGCGLRSMCRKGKRRGC
jgi:hypothetical protein